MITTDKKQKVLRQVEKWKLPLKIFPNDCLRLIFEFSNGDDILHSIRPICKLFVEMTNVGSLIFKIHLNRKSEDIQEYYHKGVRSSSKMPRIHSIDLLLAYGKYSFINIKKLMTYLETKVPYKNILQSPLEINWSGIGSKPLFCTDCYQIKGLIKRGQMTQPRDSVTCMDCGSISYCLHCVSNQSKLKNCDNCQGKLCIDTCTHVLCCPCGVGNYCFLCYEKLKYPCSWCGSEDYCVKCKDGYFSDCDVCKQKQLCPSCCWGKCNICEKFICEQCGPVTECVICDDFYCCLSCEEEDGGFEYCPTCETSMCGVCAEEEIYECKKCKKSICQKCAATHLCKKEKKRKKQKRNKKKRKKK